MNYMQKEKQLEILNTISNRPNFIEEYFSEENKIFISCCHSSKHKRAGKVKSENGEIHTAVIAMNVAKMINDSYGKELVYIIYKTNNEEDDPNYSEKSEYREYLIEKIKEKKGFLIDLHIMSEKREPDVDVGTGNEENLKGDKEMLKRIMKNLEKSELKITHNQIFAYTGKNNLSRNVAKDCKNCKADVKICISETCGNGKVEGTEKCDN